ncbi:hypothetical protein [uncultured Bifidobacterium sp.]|uniref:hypothetical protein n=1 Tax=uncultured Bifidobacterium sp. TaxID=165187 RepID=UPI00258354CF|nr:hypothetical protein [uncultured Bifidobacterium sp.]
MGTRTPFATVAELAEWIGEDIDETSADGKRAAIALRLASNRIRAYTRQEWSDAAGSVLEDLQDVCITCAGRLYTNPNAETQWTRQIDDAMDGGSRKVDEAGAYLTASEKETLDRLVADQSPVIAGLGVLNTGRGEQEPTDLRRAWDDDEDGTPVLWAKVTG